jgi:ribosomal RNA-processing protein 9
MPDSFFTKQTKRNRPSNGASTSKKPYEKPFRPALYGKGADGAKSGRRRKDEELSDDGDDAGGIDIADMNLRRDDLGGNSRAVYDSDGEEADRYESAAAKRVRLAKGYLEKVKGDLGGEIERE